MEYGANETMVEIDKITFFNETNIIVRPEYLPSVPVRGPDSQNTQVGRANRQFARI